MKSARRTSYRVGQPGSTRGRRFRAGSVARLTAIAAVLAIGSACSMPEPIRVMSFNVRYGTAPDGIDSWSHRRELVFETIRAFDPDVLGLQEVLDFQARELRAALPGYGFVGAGRDDGDRGGEFAPIMFRERTFRLVEGGQVWLSEDPQRAGTRGWDARLPRIVTWTRLRFVGRPLNEVWVFNTHFDHEGSRARLESARLLRKMVEALGGVPIVVTGDFNCGPGSPPYDVLTQNTGNASQLFDAFAAPGASEPQPGGTYHAFRGRSDGPRIDWILHNRRLRTRDAAIDRRSTLDRYPSDHFPVTATLELIPQWRWGGV